VDTSQVRSGQSAQQEDADNALAVAAHAAAEWLRRPVAQPSPSYVIHLSGPTHRHGHGVRCLAGRLLLERLQAVGAQAVVPAVQPISHREVMIIDGETVITRRFDFTKATRERNTERLLILRDPGLAKQYTRHRETHQQHR
jgi:hypothetical protein